MNQNIIRRLFGHDLWRMSTELRLFFSGVKFRTQTTQQEVFRRQVEQQAEAGCNRFFILRYLYYFWFCHYCVCRVLEMYSSHLLACSESWGGSHVDILQSSFWGAGRRQTYSPSGEYPGVLQSSVHVWNTGCQLKEFSSPLMLPQLPMSTFFFNFGWTGEWLCVFPQFT